MLENTGFMGQSLHTLQYVPMALSKGPMSSPGMEACEFLGIAPEVFV